MTARIDAVLRQAVDSGAVPNVVAVAADRARVIYEFAAGPRVAGRPEQVSADSVFRIASMTKIVCTVAALQQRDDGRLDFDEPIETYCPDFAAIQVLEGFPDGRPHLRPPAHRATVRQLVTHTAGLSYGFWNTDLHRWESTSTGGVFTTPMVADPGAGFEYGINTDWLGKVVEAVTGQPLDTYLTECVFRPLRMDTTTFEPTETQRHRLVPVHRRDDSGAWHPTDLDWTQPPTYMAGGHGLYSTPRDFLRLQRMLLNGGTLDGATILQPATVRETFTNQIGELRFPAIIRTADPAASCDFLAGPELTWGWGLLLTTRPAVGVRSVGSGGWAGMFNTYFWIDPTAGVTAAFYTQSAPFVDPRVLQANAAFEHALYATLGS